MKCTFFLRGSIDKSKVPIPLTEHLTDDEKQADLSALHRNDSEYFRQER